jgi:phosphatidylglycerol:prolipoprotein diacylglycerol transferase
MGLVSYIYWDVRPDIIRFGGLEIRWYGVFFAILFVLGYLIVRWMFRVEHKDEASLDALLFYMVVGTIVGARLGHCLFYDPVYYLRHPVEVLEVWRGGLASHGGAAGILLALYFYTRHRPDQPYLWLLDRIVVPTALGGALIRLGNLFNSEILGTPTHVPWAFVFEREDSVPRHPVQLYESIAYALIFVVLLRIYSRLRAETPRGLLLGSFLVSVFTFRFFIEFLKQHQAAYGHHSPLKVGQWLSIPFIILGAVLLWRVRRRRGRKP